MGLEKEKDMSNIAIDPVCGMEVEIESAAGKSEYGGKTYYFCATGCKKAFDENPQQYIDKQDTPGDSHDHHHHH
jgi:YHS domain-containing protein